MVEKRKRLMAAPEGNDPQAPLKAWMPLGGFEPLQKRDGAKRAAEPKDQFGR
ncbi:MAG: hypothetical protein ABSD21_06515 [Rhizomicrobium sp.]